MTYDSDYVAYLPGRQLSVAVTEVVYQCLEWTITQLSSVGLCSDTRQTDIVGGTRPSECSAVWGFGLCMAHARN